MWQGQSDSPNDSYFTRKEMRHSMTKPIKWQTDPSAQSDQRLHCPHEETYGPFFLIEHIAKTLIRLGGCPGWSESSLGAKIILLVLSCCGSNLTFHALSIGRHTNCFPLIHVLIISDGNSRRRLHFTFLIVCKYIILRISRSGFPSPGHFFLPEVCDLVLYTAVLFPPLTLPLPQFLYLGFFPHLQSKENQTIIKNLKNLDTQKNSCNTVNFLNIRTPKKFVVITLKFELCRSTIE